MPHCTAMIAMKCMLDGPHEPHPMYHTVVHFGCIHCELIARSTPARRHMHARVPQAQATSNQCP